MKPYWLSGSKSWSRWTISWFKRILAKILPAIDESEMTLWLWQAYGLPVLLYIWIVEASLNYWRVASNFYRDWKRSVSFLTKQGLPAWLISAGMAGERGLWLSWFPQRKVEQQGTGLFQLEAASQLPPQDWTEVFSPTCKYVVLLCEDCCSICI